jgi:hypothetical protein
MGTIVFAPGSARATLTIDPTADAELEPDESVVIQLLPTGDGTYELGDFQGAAALILNDDYATPPAVTQVRYGYGMNKWIDAAAIAGRTAPWKITAIAITLSRDVMVDFSDLTYTSSLGISPTGFTYDSLTFTAVWTFLEIDRNRVTFRLDGDGPDDDFNVGVRAVTGNDPPGGSFLAGGDEEWSLDVLFGDVDGTGTVNLVDALLQRGRNGTTDIWADIDGSGTVNLVDALLLRGRNGTTLP